MTALPSSPLPFVCLFVCCRRRKNKLNGSILRRKCWCENGTGDDRLTCPTHALGPIVDAVAHNQLLFEGVCASRALVRLRESLVTLNVPDARAFGTQDLRRGHARDLQKRGASLYEILSAGEWRSPAFLKYLDMYALDRDVVVEAHIDESDGEY